MIRTCLKLVALFVGLVLLGLGGYRAERHFYVEHHHREAERAVARYDFEEAERHLALCLHARPRSPALHLQMARVARRAEHYEQATEYVRKCQELEGKTPDNSLEAILIHAQAGAIVDVEKLLREQVDSGSPDANLILEALGRGYVATYRLSAAMHCVNRLLEREPDNVLALLLRASLWKAVGNHAKAEDDYRQAVEAQPEHRRARVQLGEILLFNKRAEEALPHFEYLRQRPGGDAPEVLLGLARCRRQLGDAESARQLLDELLVGHPHEGFALVERGKIALETESATTAETWLRQAIADYPYDAQAKYLLAQALRKQGKNDEASGYEAAQKRIDRDLAALDAAFRHVTANPRDPEPRLEAGRICLRNGREDEGERWLLSALEQEPKHAATRAALAEHYERIGRVELAADYRRP
ncbi:MAG TPA: tetratricopeptide repeat protein [Gemmataceae bacterium]|jgi:tetratricopeptide (TPR) repeat protein